MVLKKLYIQSTVKYSGIFMSPATTSFPFSGFFHHARPYRVKHNIPAKFKEVVLFLHQNGLISSLKEIPGFIVSSIT
jgi:hypothetical protein